MAASTSLPTTSIRWWDKPHNDAHSYIFDLVNRISNEQPARMEKNLRSLMLYGNLDVSGSSPFSFSPLAAPSLPTNRVKLNIVASMCDTVTSIIAKMKPRVSFLTEGGDAGLQTEAKKLSKFVSGLFYQNDIYTMHQRGFKDSTVLDIGALKHYVEDGQIKSERVLATELYTEVGDTLYGTPSHLYQMKFVHKDILKDLYPEYKAEIEASTNQIGRQQFAKPELMDYVAVIEAWHLPIDKNGTWGRHVISIERATLKDEEYNKPYFPFTFFRWSEMPIGFYGQSLTERLTGNQIEINKMLRIIQKSFVLGATFKVFLEYGSKVVKEHLNNDIGSIVYYNGTPPQFYVPKTVHEEYFRHLDWLIKNSYEEAGVSRLSAASQKPAGLDSAVAMREYNDIQTERFAIVSQQYEQSFLQTARIYLDLARELYADENVDMEIKSPAKKFIESIKWSDIDLEADQYIMKMFPTSMLPHEPAGRLAFVQEMMQAGIINQDWGLELLDFPDTENYLSLKNAAIEDIMDTIDRIVNHGEFVSPEPFQNLQLGLEMMQNAYLRAKKERVPEKRLQMLRDWMAHADALLKKGGEQAQAGQPQMAQAQGTPQAEQMAAHNLAPAQLVGTPQG